MDVRTIKLRINVFNERIFDFYCKQFVELSQEREHGFKLVLQLQTHETEVEDVNATGWQEATYTTTLSYTYVKKRLVPFMSDYIRACQQFCRQFEWLKPIVPTVRLDDLQLFSEEIRSAMTGITLDGIAFGSFVGDLMQMHYPEARFFNADNRTELLSFNKGAWSNNKDFEFLQELSINFRSDWDRITADFMFDLADNLAIIHLPTFDSISAKRDRFIKEFRLELRKKSIKRIVVDPVVDGQFTVFFVLTDPVCIRLRNTKIVEGGRQLQRGQIAAASYHRETQIFTNFAAQTNAQAFNETDVLSFFFNEEFGKEDQYTFLSRLTYKLKLPIEFTRVNFGRKFLANGPEDVFERYMDGQPWKEDILLARIELEKKGVAGKDAFAVVYLIECLMTRGAVVKDALLINRATWTKFLDLVVSEARKNVEHCLRSMELMVRAVQDHITLGDILKMLERFFKLPFAEQDNQIEENLAKSGYISLRKVVVTPTRIVCLLPEQTMSNFVIRKCDPTGEKTVRVYFRDEDNKTLTYVGKAEIIRSVIERGLEKGMNIAGRVFRFVGSSNSQLREHGAYLMAMMENDIWKIRDQLAPHQQFNCIPKYLSRLGQYFTQSQESQVVLKADNYCVVPDVIGGCNRKGDPYIFTDGVGSISVHYATTIGKQMKMRTTYPSVVQFRLLGMKGIVTVDPRLDEMNMERRRQHRSEAFCIFRKSQKKFHAQHDEHTRLCVVKCSQPSPVNLNRQVITVLDQLAKKQSSTTHKRICERLNELVEMTLNQLVNTLLTEEGCRNKLKDLVCRVDVEMLEKTFNLSCDPFFRSLIKCCVRYAMSSKQLGKLGIQMPAHLGRTMFGVADDTGRLQYGQVFVKYTKNLKAHFAAQTVVLQGDVMVTKNPTSVAGDVRIFKAVDVPELHHLCDCIVFPIHGPRPHPDEMAGSDLDGDEYCVIWDKELMFDRNEEPFDYTAMVKLADKELNRDVLVKEITDFVVDFVSKDNVGQVANAFLYNADQYGIFSEVCQSLATKYTQGLDFQKTGVKPGEMRKKWESRELDDGKMHHIPPEFLERRPDFAIQNSSSAPIYRSSRLMGQLFRDVQSIVRISDMADLESSRIPIVLDPLLEVDGWEQYQAAVEKEFAQYCNEFRNAMRQWKIATEAEFFTGYLLSARDSLWDSDEGGSFFTAEKAAETKCTLIYQKYRQRFFNEFGGWREMTEVNDKPNADEDNVFERIAKSEAPELHQKAYAYYRVCYDAANQNMRKDEILSFAWLPFDVLSRIKQKKALDTERYPIEMFQQERHPLDKALKAYMTEYCVRNRYARDNFVNGVPGDGLTGLRMYMLFYPELENILFILNCWAKNEGVLANGSRLKSTDVSKLFVMYALNEFDTFRPTEKPPLEEVPFTAEQIREMLMTGGKQSFQRTIEGGDTALLGFIHFLASRKFANLHYVTTRPVTVMTTPASTFRRGEWKALHEAAKKTFYSIVLNMQLEQLSSGPNGSPANAAIVEMEPFFISLPDGISGLVVLSQLLARDTKCEQVVLRPYRSGNMSRVIVSARGTLAATHRLRDLLMPPLYFDEAEPDPEIAEEMKKKTLYRILFGMEADGIDELAQAIYRGDD